MHTFCEELNTLGLTSHWPPNIAAVPVAYSWPRLKRMTWSREWLQFELCVQSTGTPPVMDSGGRSAWVREDTKVVSPEVRVSSQEAEYCFPVGGRRRT